MIQLQWSQHTYLAVRYNDLSWGKTRDRVGRDQSDNGQDQGYGFGTKEGHCEKPSQEVRSN